MVGQGKEWFCLVYLLAQVFHIPALIIKLHITGANDWQAQDYEDGSVYITFCFAFYHFVCFSNTLWFFFVYYECVTAIPQFFSFKMRDGLSDWRYSKQSKIIYIASAFCVIALVLMAMKLQKIFHHQWFIACSNLIYCIMHASYYINLKLLLKEFHSRWGAGLKFTLDGELLFFAFSLLLLIAIYIATIIVSVLVDIQEDQA